MLRPDNRLIPVFNNPAPLQQHVEGNHIGTGLSLVDLQASFVQAGQVSARKLRRGAADGFINTCERWRLAKSDQIALLGYAGDEFGAERVLRNQIRASQDVLDRTGYVLGISIGLSALFNNSIDAELAWLNRPHAQLGNVTPMAHMLQGKMLGLINVFQLVSQERAL